MSPVHPEWVDLRGQTTNRGEYDKRELSDIERIVFHHVGAGVNRDFTAEELADYHAKTRKWPGIGYHFLAHPDGRLDYVGDIRTVRYHAGLLNGSSVGICLAGDFTNAEPTKAQLGAANAARLWVNEQVGRILPVVGHRDVSHLTGYGWTACPGNTWETWRQQLIA